jgi:hypothetical protein
VVDLLLSGMVLDELPLCGRTMFTAASTLQEYVHIVSMLPPPSRVKQQPAGELQQPMKNWASLDRFHDEPDGTFNLQLAPRHPHRAFTACFTLLMLVNVGYSYDYSYYDPVLDAHDCE